ncbi:unnamed protein product [Haemonchus placei]|uniref:Secreted protein n=1 Tax=Haemonchus placei TaxID=6290 RepID=A0A0N4WV35_HAEPC|nr:unnamed protein product [Haemonchus placei]
MLASRFRYVVAIICILYTGGISAKKGSTKKTTTPSTTESQSTKAPNMSYISPSSSPTFSNLHQDTTSESTMTPATVEDSTPTVTSTDGPSSVWTSAEEGDDASDLTTPGEKPNPFEATTPGIGSNSSESSTPDYRSGEFDSARSNDKSNSSKLTTSDDQPVPTNRTISNDTSGSSESTAPVGGPSISVEDTPDKSLNSTDGETTTPGSKSNSSESTEPNGEPKLFVEDPRASGSQLGDSASAIGFSLLTVVVTKLILW